MQAQEKKKLVKDGKLDKHGRTNEATPAGWKAEYVDYTVQGEGLPAAQIPTQPPAAAEPAKIEEVKDEAAASPKKEKSKDKKRSRDEGEEKAETAEEKAARKAAKSEFAGWLDRVRWWSWVLTACAFDGLQRPRRRRRRPRSRRALEWGMEGEGGCSFFSAGLACRMCRLFSRCNS